MRVLVLSEGKKDDLSLIREEFNISIYYARSAKFFSNPRLYSGRLSKFYRLFAHLLVILEGFLWRAFRSGHLCITQEHWSFLLVSRCFGLENTTYLTSNFVTKVKKDYARIVTSNELTSLYLKGREVKSHLSQTWTNFDVTKDFLLQGETVVILLQSVQEHNHLKSFMKQYIEELILLVNHLKSNGNSVILKTHPRTIEIPYLLRSMGVTVADQLTRSYNYFYLSSCSTLTYELNVLGYKSYYYRSCFAERAFQFESKTKSLIEFYNWNEEERAINL